jgi:hypothetical protein
VIIRWLSTPVRKGEQPPWIVPDGLWARIEPLLPAVPRRADHPGRAEPGGVCRRAWPGTLSARSAQGVEAILAALPAITHRRPGFQVGVAIYLPRQTALQLDMGAAI